nr:MAG TPA: hypothetical protein [Caudoviricetes sp.]
MEPNSRKISVPLAILSPPIQIEQFQRVRDDRFDFFLWCGLRGKERGLEILKMWICLLIAEIPTQTQLIFRREFEDFWQKCHRLLPCPRIKKADVPAVTM